MVERVSVSASTRSPTGQTNAYVLGDERVVLVDPAQRTPAVDDAVADRDLAHVLVTHTHPDHVGGVAACADEATVWAHAEYRERFREATGVDPDETFAEGTAVPSDPAVSVLETPGHSPDHVALSVDARDEHAVVCGDLAVDEGSVVVGSPEGEMAAYLDSLRRIRDLDPDRLYPGHGPVIDDPEAALTRLIDHRLDRERKVLSAVEAGAETPQEVTDAAYEKDLTGVRDLAEATVVAHLEKLAAEGRIRFDGERAHPL